MSHEKNINKITRKQAYNMCNHIILTLGATKETPKKIDEIIELWEKDDYIIESYKNEALKLCDDILNSTNSTSHFRDRLIDLRKNIENIEEVL
jgi:hypothetical protein